MCGRFTLSRSAAEIVEHFGLAPGAADAPVLASARYNIAPSQSVAVVRASRGMGEAGGRVLEGRRWGLVPHWSKQPGSGGRMVNARIESAATRPAFRQAFRRRRCLLPADGFYEWCGPARRRQPYHLSLPAGALFAFAGLYEHWEAPDAGAVLDSCVVLTTAAQGEVARLHDRMPVLVAPERYDDWLDPDLEDPERIASLLAAGPSEALTGRPVGLRLNDVRFDGPECLEEPLPALFPELQETHVPQKR